MNNRICAIKLSILLLFLVANVGLLTLDSSSDTFDTYNDQGCQAVSHPEIVAGGMFYLRGALIDLHDSVMKEINIPCPLSFAPTKRALLLLKQRKKSILIPFISGRVNDVVEVPLGIVLDKFLIIRTDRPAITSTKQLEGKKVGLQRGFVYPYSLLNNPNIAFEFVDHYEQNYKKLSTGRIDAFIISDLVNIEAVMEKLKITNLKIGIEQPISSENISALFNNDSKGQALATSYKLALNKLREQGKIIEIFKRHNLNILDINE